MKCLILIIGILPLCMSNPCGKDEYWSSFSKVCFKCTQCKSNQIVIRSCQPHKDTICSVKAKIIKHNRWNNNNNQDNKNNKLHHFDKTKIHFISNEDAEQEILHNELNYPTLNLKLKLNDDNHHKINKKKHNNNDGKKQRINDKFLKWNDNDDDDNDKDKKLDDGDDYNYDDYDDNYDVDKKHDTIKTNKQKDKQKHHHYSSLDNTDEDNDDDDDDSDDDDDYSYDDDDDDEQDDDYEDDENNLDAILDKHSKNSWNTKKWKDSLIMSKNKKKTLLRNDKNLAKLAKLEDEKKLEEWLRQSRKQFKDRKDNLLKTLKEEQLDKYKNDKRVRLNYPLLNLNDKYGDSVKYNVKTSVDNKLKAADERKHNGDIDSEVELFKELIKNEESQEMELATLMSNKKEPTLGHYKAVTPAHRMFLGEPSSDLVKLGAHIKDPQQVIKEEMGNNFIYEKSKFTVLPVLKNENNAEMMEFSAAERLVWDWQAVAVISAVISSFLFFLVIGIFLLSNARQWNADKHHYTADNEELSTRVALIQPTLEASAAEGNQTSKFLEQFLSINEEANKSEINKSIAKNCK